MQHTAQSNHSAKSDLNRLVRILGIAVLMGLAVVSCQHPFGNAAAPAADGDGIGATGAIQITFGGELGASTLLPDVDMGVDSYRLNGIGPNGASFSESVSTGSTTITRIAPGAWTITVTAHNATGMMIGRGSASTTVVSGETAPISITVSPLPGDGTLEIGVTWPAGELTAASVEGSAIPSGGDPIPLTFTMGADGSATADPLALPGGYYRLSIRLREGDNLAAGAVDVARIVTDAKTSGTIDFAAVNVAGGNVTVNIDQEMDDPLTVELSGATAQLTEGQSATLTASIAETDVQATFEWYLDGGLVSTDASYTIPADLSLGAYRLDVVAVGVDRFGSTSHDFTVVSQYDPVLIQATEFTLSWDPPTDGTTVVSYNLYYRVHGTVDWTLLGSVAAGPSPTYTVSNADLAYGVYDFAVTSVDAEGDESEIHTSLDETAEPDGWFLDWRAP